MHHRNLDVRQSFEFWPGYVVQGPPGTDDNVGLISKNLPCVEILNPDLPEYRLA
jgi:hypothetical protein